MAEGEIFNKKEQYEEKKKQKSRQSKRRSIIKSLKRAAVWVTVILTVAFTAGGILIFLREGGNQATNGSIEDFILKYPIQGREHIEIGSSHPDYNSNPPTSGWHYPEPAKWGIYDRELSDEQLVHNLEHCGIWLSYQLSIASSTKENLVSFAKEFPTKVILTPRPKNDSPIVLASWGVLMKLGSFEPGKMNAFIASFLNRNGPECQAP